MQRREGHGQSGGATQVLRMSGFFLQSLRPARPQGPCAAGQHVGAKPGPAMTITCGVHALPIGVNGTLQQQADRIDRHLGRRVALSGKYPYSPCI